MRGRLCFVGVDKSGSLNQSRHESGLMPDCDRNSLERILRPWMCTYTTHSTTNIIIVVDCLAILLQSAPEQ